MKIVFPVLLMILLSSGCAHGPAAPNESQTTPTRHNNICYFQHRLVPNLLHHSGGKFFSDLDGGVPDPLREAAQKIVDEDFADALEIVPINDGTGYLLKFQKPVEAPECFYAIMTREGSQYVYFTLEKTVDFIDSGDQTVLGMWTSEGSHLNLGPRRYSDADSFVQEITSVEAGH